MKEVKNSRLIEQIYDEINSITSLINSFKAEENYLSPIDKDLLMEKTRKLYELMFHLQVQSTVFSTEETTESQEEVSASEEIQLNQAEEQEISFRPMVYAYDTETVQEEVIPEEPTDMPEEVNVQLASESRISQAVPEQSLEPKEETPIDDTTEQLMFYTEQTLRQAETPDLFSSAPSESIADKLGADSEPSIASKLEHLPIPDLRQAIGINDKFLFVNELFEGNLSQYTKAIEELNSFQSLNGARTYLIELSILYAWPKESEAKEKLLQIIERKLSY